VSTIRQWLLNWRIRRTREAIAYWSAKAEMFRQVCRYEHTIHEQTELIEATANCRRMQSRLAALEGRTP
jgi:hypothetical protein